jgi:hypothetical protein
MSTQFTAPRRFVTAALVGLLTIVALPAAASAAPNPGRAAAGDPALNEIISDSNRLRRDLGFPPQAATFASARHARAALNEWGFVGTAAESAEMQRRGRVVRALDTQRAALTAAPGFAGTYLDNANGAKLVIQYAGTLPSPALMSAVRGAIGPDAVEFRVVGVSSAAIDAAIRAVWAWAGSRAGDMIGSVGEDVKTNGMVVGIKPGVDPAPIADLLRARGISARFVTGEGSEEVCTSRNACDSPRRGGVGVDDTIEACTTGWIVVREGRLGALSAGHCWFTRTSGTLTSNGLTYGSMTSVNALRSGTSLDMRFISIADNAQSWLYQDSGFPNRPVNGFSFGTVGDTACLFGRNADRPRCGSIVSTNTSHISDICGGCAVLNQVSANYESANGDSGGAVGASTTGSIARGTHSGAFHDGKHFSSLNFIERNGLGKLATV